MLKLHLAYISIGVSTLALNLFLTLRIIRNRKSREQKHIHRGDDIITFRLTGEGGSEGNTTEAALYDDTVALR